MLYRTYASEELDRMLDFIPNVLVLDRSAERAERGDRDVWLRCQVVTWVGCGNPPGQSRAGQGGIILLTQPIVQSL